MNGIATGNRSYSDPWRTEESAAGERGELVFSGETVFSDASFVGISATKTSLARASISEVCGIFAIRCGQSWHYCPRTPCFSITPICMLAAISRASSECPESSNASVASLPRYFYEHRSRIGGSKYDIHQLRRRSCHLHLDAEKAVIFPSNISSVVTISAHLVKPLGDVVYYKLNGDIQYGYLKLISG